MDPKTIIIIVVVLILLAGICSGPKGNPAPDRKSGKVDHLLTSAKDPRYFDSHTTRGQQLKNNKKKKR